MRDLFKTAEQVCSVPNHDQAFACLDMTYIAALLHHGFGLSHETQLLVRKSYFLEVKSLLKLYLNSAKEENRWIRDELGIRCSVPRTQQWYINAYSVKSKIPLSLKYKLNLGGKKQ